MDGHVLHISPSSLHQQVTADLLTRIEAGQLRPGEKMPTEIALCREYGVSRITVRRAVAVLVERGLVTRQRGVGSFVTGRAPDLREFHLTGFLDDKLAFAHRMLCNVVERADARIAAALALPVGSTVRRISSLVHRDGEPFTVVDAYTADTPELRAAVADFAEAVPSVHAMGRRLGRRITRAEQELDAVAADALTARHLGVPRRTPVIRARRIYYASGDQPIQYLVVRYHPDRYRFIVDLVPRSGTTAFAAT
jgi:GntR family transcriptional regulator